MRRALITTASVTVGTAIGLGIGLTTPILTAYIPIPWEEK